MLLLSTSSLKGYGLHKIFKLTKQAGYDGINLDIEKLNYDTLDVDYIAGLINEFQLPVYSITVPDKGVDEEKAEKYIEMAKTLKSQIVVFSPPHLTDKSAHWFLKGLPAMKNKNTISIAVQNVEPKIIFFLIPEYRNNSFMEIKKVTGDSVLNISNISQSSGIDLMKAYQILGTSIKNIFVSDTMVGSKNLLVPGKAGGGTSFLPIESFFMKLKTNGYNGYMTLKVRPMELNAGNDNKVLQNLEDFKKYYKKHFLEYKA